MNPLDGHAPIHYAARNGYTEIFKYLVSKLENPNPAKQDGWTPMHLAAQFGQIEIIKILGSILENPNAPKPDGWTPLQLAIHHNMIEAGTTILEIISKKVKSNPQEILNTLRK